MKKRWVLASVFLLPLLTVSPAKGDGVTVRWDIVHLTFPSGTPTLDPGGHASATAEDSSKITFTGSGTFQLGEDGEATGGGTWSTSVPAASGNYVVTGLIKFDVAPGSLPPVIVDRIGNAHSGLAFLRIRYSDGSRGVLVVSCHLPGAPDAIFEGVTASKGYVDYWNHEAAVPGVDADRTHISVTTSED